MTGPEGQPPAGAALNGHRPAGTSVLAARGLTKHFKIRERGMRGSWGPKRVVHAAEDISLDLRAGQVSAVVGESGSGKTTLARMLAWLVRPTSGQILLDGEPTSRRHVRAYRHRVQIVFQDPFASLNPVHDVHYHLARPLRIHRRARGRAAVDEAVEALLARVRLEPPASSCTSCRTSCPAGSASGWRSPGPSLRARACCSPTSRCPCSTCRSGSAS